MSILEGHPGQTSIITFLGADYREFILVPNGIQYADL